MMNSITAPRAKSIGVANFTLPRMSDSTKERVMTSKGSEMAMVATLKAPWSATGIPVRNMWCIHTPKLRGMTMSPVATRMAFLAARGLPVNWGSMFATTPNPGRRTMYTSGCPKNQNRLSQSMEGWMLLAVKNTVPRILSVEARTKAAMRVGKAKSMATMVKKMNQVNMGSFASETPGALSQIIEVRKLTLPSVIETARSTIPRYARVGPGPCESTARG
jgi:hypothetical protein